MAPDESEDRIAARVRQAMTAYQLRLDTLEGDMRDLKTAFFGNKRARQPGVVDQLDKIDAQVAGVSKAVEGLDDKFTAVEHKISGARVALVAVGAIGSIPAVNVILTLLGLWP